MTEVKRKEVESLIDKAAKTSDAKEALGFSQAACNCANAIRCLIDSEYAVKQN